MRTKLVLVLFLVLSLMLFGCGLDLGSKATPTATSAPATNTPPPAPTQAATNTPKPANTAAPTATKASVAEPTATKAVISESTAATEAKPTTDGGQGGVVKKGGGTVPEDSTLVVLSHAAWLSDSGDMSIVGEVQNVSDQPITTMVTIAALLKDEGGQSISGDFGAYLDRPVIQPGDTSSFWILVMSDQLGVAEPSTTDYELTTLVSEDASPDVEITVDRSEATEDSGYLYVTGTATNNTELTFGSLSIYSVVYDDAGSVVNATVDIMDLDTPLAPGQSTDFEGYFLDHFENGTTHSVVVTGWTTDQTGGSEEPPSGQYRSGDDVFSFDSHTGWVDDNGNVSIVGYVTNISADTINTLVTVEAKLTDADGNAVAGEFTAYLDRPVIEPGGWSSFWVLITADQLGDVDPAGLTDYELITWISPDPSPDVELVVDSSSGTAESDAYYVAGQVTNQTDLEFVALAVYSSLYDADGNLVNATVDIMELDTPLAPGAQTDFSGYFIDHFDNAETYEVFVTGYTAEAAGM